MRLRSKAQQEELKNKLSGIDTEHFGADVSSFVDLAASQGGSLDETSRRTMYGEIKKNALKGSSLRKAVPGFIADHIEEHKKTGGEIFQSDARVGPRKSESYSGHMITSTHVNAAHGVSSEEKTISQPLSPQPYSADSGSYHRTHTSPFNLVGDASNKAHTVWAPGWANVTVDGFIEKKASKAQSKGHDVFHFRFDTDTHSTVGFVRHNTSTNEFKSFQANYKRR